MRTDADDVLNALSEEWRARQEEYGRRDYDAVRDTPVSAALAAYFLAGRNKRCECGGEDGSCIHQDECLAWHAAARALGVE